MNEHIKIALIGDYNDSVTAHQAIPLAIELAADELSVSATYKWLDTDSDFLSGLDAFDAIWCVPASPYRNMEAALSAISYARKYEVPFLGTCGGYQHAALEYARNVLGYAQAGNAEVDPDAEMPLVSVLTCSLVEKNDSILIKAGSKAAGIYQSRVINETYHCSYGVNRSYLSIFDPEGMQFSGFDEAGDPRILEIRDHSFFIGTAFQPERSALNEQSHPLVVAFLRATLDSSISSDH